MGQTTDKVLVERYQRMLVERGVVPVGPAPWEGYLGYACSLLEQIEDLPPCSASPVEAPHAALGSEGN